MGNAIKISKAQAVRIKKLKEAQSKFIPYIIEQQTVDFLIPKKHNSGYLQVPIGHHVHPLSSKITHEIGYDSTGIDGYIEVDTGWTRGKEFSKLVKLISDHYGWPCKLVDRDWWFYELQNKR